MRFSFSDPFGLAKRRRERDLRRRMAEIDREYEQLIAGLYQEPERIVAVPSARPVRRRRRENRSAGRVFLAGAMAVALTGYGVVEVVPRVVDVVRGPFAGLKQPETGGFSYLATQPDDERFPISYSACARLDVSVDDGLAAPEAEGLVEEAVAEVVTATGLDIEVGTDRRGAYPVTVTWTTPEQQPKLEGEVVGLGGSTSVRDPAQRLAYYIGGTVELDSPALNELLEAGDRGREAVRSVMMHELGHVVGLDHVKDRTQLMFAENIGVTEFGLGDLRGLEQLGNGPCLRGAATPPRQVVAATRAAPQQSGDRLATARSARGTRG